MASFSILSSFGNQRRREMSVLLFCLLNIVCSNAFMDMEELKSVYYGLDILNEPVMIQKVGQSLPFLHTFNFLVFFFLILLLPLGQGKYHLSLASTHF